MLDKFGQDVFVEGSGEVALEQLVVVDGLGILAIILPTNLK